MTAQFVTPDQARVMERGEIGDLLTFPARPVNGGHLDRALPKPGAWYYEPKYNGWRALVHVPTGQMWNRHGQRLSIAGEFAHALAQIRQTAGAFEWLDCEALERRHGIGRGSLIILDAPMAGLPYTVRRSILIDRLGYGIRSADIFMSAWKNDTLRESGVPNRLADNSVYLAPSYTSASAVELWQQLQSANAALGCDFYEGLVAKRADSNYPIQLRNPKWEFAGWMKHRFV